MLSSEENKFIYQYAYIPEHLVEYVFNISEAKPNIFEGYLYYLQGNHIIFIAYPLNRHFDETEANKFLKELINKHRIKSVAVISAKKLNIEGNKIFESSDSYYFLKLSNLAIKGKLKNSIKRASRDLKVEVSKIFTPYHGKIIDEYVKMEKFDKFTKYIFQMIPRYIENSSTSLLINAKTKEGSLAAFNVIDLGSKHYAFYMFNFISRKLYVPGVSDLLMYEITKIAKNEGKDFINLGLGINNGVLFFKKKWGGQLFLNYHFTYHNLTAIKDYSFKRLLSFISRYF